jgi:hypothetical protein
VKAVVAIVGITAGGRLLIRPLYRKISNLHNAEIFSATTLLVVLGTSFMTQLAGEQERTQQGVQGFDNPVANMWSDCSGDPARGSC